MKNFFNYFNEYYVEIIGFILAIGVSGMLISLGYFCYYEPLEEKCVSYYKDTGYILKKCEKYEYKLEKLEKNL